MKFKLLTHRISRNQIQARKRFPDAVHRFYMFFKELEVKGEDCRGDAIRYIDDDGKFRWTNKARFRIEAQLYLTALAELLDYPLETTFLEGGPAVNADMIGKFAAVFEVWLPSEMSTSEDYVPHGVFGCVRNKTLFRCIKHGPLNSTENNWFDSKILLTQPFAFPRLLASIFKPSLNPFLTLTSPCPPLPPEKK